MLAQREIKNRVQFCTPAGVCDPNDPNACERGGAPPPVRIPIDAKLLDRLSAIDELLGSAVFGASETVFDKSGVARMNVLSLGETSGVFRRADGSAYSWILTLKRDADGTTFDLTLEEARTFGRESFSGRFDRGGVNGFVHGTTLAFTQFWDLSSARERDR
jgi:hypothetical protein